MAASPKMPSNNRIVIANSGAMAYPILPYLIEADGQPTYDGRFVPNRDDFDRTVGIIAGGDANKVVSKTPLFGSFPGTVAHPPSGMVFTAPG